MSVNVYIVVQEHYAHVDACLQSYTGVHVNMCLSG